MDISSLPKTPGARKVGKRLGRGVGSGRGKTAGRGQKGQGARTGSKKKPGFEGGRNPLIRSVPKRGFIQKATGRPEPMAIVNLGQLERCGDQELITPETLQAFGLIRSSGAKVKLLGEGSIDKKWTVRVHAASRSAKAKLEKAGGSIEIISAMQAQKS